MAASFRSRQCLHEFEIKIETVFSHESLSLRDPIIRYKEKLKHHVNINDFLEMYVVSQRCDHLTILVKRLNHVSKI